MYCSVRYKDRRSVFLTNHLVYCSVRYKDRRSVFLTNHLVYCSVRYKDRRSVFLTNHLVYCSGRYKDRRSVFLTNHLVSCSGRDPTIPVGPWSSRRLCCIENCFCANYMIVCDWSSVGECAEGFPTAVWGVLCTTIYSCMGCVMYNHLQLYGVCYVQPSTAVWGVLCTTIFVTENLFSRVVACTFLQTNSLVKK